MSSPSTCGLCGAPIEPSETISVVGEGDRCHACFNREAGDRLGLAFDNTPLQPIVVTDIDGIPHTFEIRSMLVPTGHSMEALETGDRQSGYRFQILGDHEADALSLFQHLYAKIRREMAVRHVERNEFGWQIGPHRRLVGRLEWGRDTDGAVPLLVGDGKAFTWEQVGRMLTTVEGFTLDASIEDSIELVDDRAENDR